MADRDVLPDNVKPVHYELSLRDMDFDAWSYKGTVTIHSHVLKPTKTVVLNALELKLLGAKVVLDEATTVDAAAIAYDAKAQRATITLAREIPASPAKVAIVVDFEGAINHEMAGFYRSMYKPAAPPAASVPRDDEWHYMLSTQFESCDARRAFPCFDEPNLKATFDLEIEVPRDLVALSNMPVRSTRPSPRGDGDGNAWHVVAFETSPVMSSYLLAWAVGDFDYIEQRTVREYCGRPIPVRVYTTRGLAEQGRWALQHAPQIIDYFSHIFGLDYPLPKCDLIAVHEFTHGAMENWGLITFRTTRVLFDDKTSDSQSRNAVAYVVAHELAHQWFGNLVTMDWWDELWLNEGFATWVGWHAVDHLHPDWQVWSQFVNEGMENAFRLDGIRASHPIHVPVRDALDINQIFDHISYLKGCSVIRMLANHLGVGTFLRGVSAYLKAHAYGNARTAALWKALGDASGKNVDDIMHPWISKIGHPVLTVAEDLPGRQISIRQSRFLSTGDVRPEDDSTTWWVPLRLAGKRPVGHTGLESDSPAPAHPVALLSLTQKEETIRRGLDDDDDYDDDDDDFYKLNSGATGFYRVNYPPARLAKLSTQLDRLSTEDKISIIGSTAALAYSGDATTASLLTFLRGFGREDHPLVWSQVLDSLASVKSVFNEDPDIRRGLNAFAVKLLDDKVKQVGWHFPEGEDYLGGILRKSLIGSAVASGHPEICAEAIRQFNAWAHDPSASPIHASLRSAVYRAGIDHDPARAVPLLKHEWFHTTSVDGKLITLAALAAVRDEVLLRDAVIPFNFNAAPPANAVPAADMHVICARLASNPAGRALQWRFLRDNWGLALHKLGNPVVVDRFVGSALGGFTDDALVPEIDAFFADKDTKSFDRTLETAKDKIRGRAAYKRRDATALREWLGANGYLV